MHYSTQRTLRIPKFSDKNLYGIPKSICIKSYGIP